jgi:hypothetical protein
MTMRLEDALAVWLMLKDHVDNQLTPPEDRLVIERHGLEVLRLYRERADLSLFNKKARPVSRANGAAWSKTSPSVLRAPRGQRRF